MPKIVLKNKPLVEAIFELRWELAGQASGAKVDSYFSLLIGKMYERLSGEYPFHERLPTADIPEEISAYVIQHRFRRGQGQWPLVQLGPGIVTLNDTEDYDWETFAPRISQLIDALFDAYPASGAPKVSALQLRYIDAMEFDFAANDVFQFLRSNMKIDVKLHPDLFSRTGVDSQPLTLDWRLSFRSHKPAGAMHLRFARGERNGTEALVWETMVRTHGGPLPDSTREIVRWAEDAHSLTHAWFFEMIRGEELERRFDLCQE